MTKKLFKLKITSYFQRNGAYVVILVLVLAFLILSSEVHESLNGQKQIISTIDHSLANFFADQRSPAFTEAAINITALGSKWVLSLIVFISAMYLLFLKRYNDSLIFLITAIGAAVLNYYMKNFFEIPRPEIQSRLVEEHGYSYPSGHSQASAAIYLALAFILMKPLRNNKEKMLTLISFLLLIGLIGLSRIYLSVHFFSDVTAGIIAGFFWALTVQLFIKDKKFNSHQK
ncbi:MAG: phosphatase PAP2 family protein [Bdellovibrionaceae bacterium]|nr:phosphatase PAP2 family protein [Pseudobdellovibrionaceae bacterium]